MKRADEFEDWEAREVFADGRVWFHLSLPSNKLALAVRGLGRPTSIVDSTSGSYAAWPVTVLDGSVGLGVPRFVVDETYDRWIENVGLRPRVPRVVSQARLLGMEYRMPEPYDEWFAAGPL